MNLKKELTNNSYIDYWMPMYKKQYFVYKMQNDEEAIKSLERNIKRSIKLNGKEKKEIIKKIKGE